MSLHPLNERLRERILSMGGAGSGKSYDFLSVAALAAKTGSDAQFYVLDTDAAVERMLTTEFPGLDAVEGGNVHLETVFDWQALIDGVEKFQVAMQPQDWLCVDLLSPTWDMVQEFYCLVPETRVLTDDLRWVVVGDLRHGDGLVGFDEHKAPTNKSREWRRAEVIAPTVKVLPCWEVTFSDGTMVVASAEHPWLTRGSPRGGMYRWVATQDMAVGVTKVVKPVDVWSEADTRSREAGYLAAAFDGEGCYTNTTRAPRLAFVQADNAMLDQVQRALKDLGFHYTVTERAMRDVRDQSVIQLGRREDLLRLMGMARPARLLEKFDADRLGPMLGTRTVTVAGKRFVGPREVIAFGTTTRTFIAEGLASHNTEQVFSRGMEEYFLEARKANKQGSPFEGWKDWPVINRLYRGFMNRLLRTPGHLYCTAVADAFSAQDADKEVREIFGPHGVKPRGQKHTAHYFHTVLWKKSTRGGWVAVTVKDRGRQMLEGAPIANFPLSYLVKVAGWRP